MRKRTLRTTSTRLGAIAGPMVVILLSVVGCLLIYVQIGRTAGEMRAEAERAVRLAEIQSAVQREASFAAAYVSGASQDPLLAATDASSDIPAHDDLDDSDTNGTLDHHPEVIEAMQQIELSLAELRERALPEDLPIIEAIAEAHGQYVVSLRNLDAAAHARTDPMYVYHAETQLNEEQLRSQISRLRDRSRLRLQSAADRSVTSEYAFRFVLPAVVLAGLFAGVQLIRNRRTRQRVASLEHLMGAKDEFIAAVSHELRTPLTGVVGFADLLRQHGGSMSESERNEILATIADQSQEMGALVEDLLVAARLEIDQVTVTLEPVSLRSESHRVVGMLQADVEVAGEPEVVVTADSVRVRQIVRNLLTNADRYGTGAATVEIGADGHAGWVRVGSRGPEIDAEDRERIFEAYQRAHQHPGLAGSIGLGLAVSRKLARLMDGELVYFRRRELNVFELRLPLHEPTDRARLAKPGTPVSV